MIRVYNIGAKTEIAKQVHNCSDLQQANNLAKVLSKDFWGIFAIEASDVCVCVYKDGRRYKSERNAISK